MSRTGFVIRVARAADVPAMHAIRCAVRENRLTDPRRVTAADYLPYADAGSIWLVEDATPTVLGFAALDLVRASVWALFVDPAAEGAGLGRMLHDFMLARAADRGLEHLSLSTAIGTRAERFYRAAGWHESGRDATDIRFDRAVG